jgi:hypothetical protein
MIARLIAALGVAVALGAASSTAWADELTPAKRADIKTLMELTGAYGIANQLADLATIQLVRSIRGSSPSFPQKGIDAIRDEMNKLFKEEMIAPGGLAEQLVPIYGNHFTHPEVKELVAFYKSPLGSKLLQEMPLVAGESFQAGRQWGSALGPKVDSRWRARLKQENIDVPAPAAQAPVPKAPAPQPPPANK